MAFTKEQALMAIDREKEVLTNASDRVWDNPETAFQEFKFSPRAVTKIS